MKLLRLLLVPFALLAVAFVRLAWPRLKIRFGTLWMSRLGHLAANTETYLCERTAGQHAGFTDLWIGYGEPANAQLYRMIKRALPVGGAFLRLVALCFRLFEGHERHTVPSGDLDRDPQNLLERSPPHLSFTFAEEERGQAGLRRMGLPHGAPLVCLIVRDGAYLPALGYHAYRDADIETYRSACQMLTERGYYVIRMGAAVAKPITFASPRVIDYATNGMRSDFMDIYLGAKCAFCISTGCGFDGVPYIFRRSICYTNFAPLEYLYTFAPHSLAIWKHHEKDGKRMTLAEIYESKAGHFMRAEDYAKAGITIVGNTPEEIATVVKEMADTYNTQHTLWPRQDANSYSGYEVEEVEDWMRMGAFWHSFPRSVSEHNKRALHGEIRMRIGAEFLKGYS